MHLYTILSRMQLYTILSPCQSIHYYPHANLYPIIPMQIYTLLSPWHDNPPFLVLPIFTTLLQDTMKKRVKTESVSLEIKLKAWNQSTKKNVLLFSAFPSSKIRALFMQNLLRRTQEKTRGKHPSNRWPGGLEPVKMFSDNLVDENGRTETVIAWFILFELG